MLDSISPKNFDPESAIKNRMAVMWSHASKNPHVFRREFDKTEFSVLSNLVGENQKIERELWTDTSVFSNLTVENLCHPHHRLLWHRFLKGFKPRSENLVIAGCAGQKPYIKNKKFFHWKKLSKLGFFDFMVDSLHPVSVIPEDTSTSYPNCFYDWPHTMSENLDNLYTQFDFAFWVEFLRKFPYKKVIMVVSNDKKRQFLVKNLRQVVPDVKIYDIVEDGPYFKEVLAETYTNSAASRLWRSRIDNLKCTRRAICEILGNDPELLKAAYLEPLANAQN